MTESKNKETPADLEVSLVSVGETNTNNIPYPNSNNIP